MYKRKLRKRADSIFSKERKRAEMRSKYEKAREKIGEEQRFQNEQRYLKEKYDIPQTEDVIIKERSNALKFTLRILAGAIKTIASIIFICLAAIGILTLIYPQIREEFVTVIQAILGEVSSMI